MRPQTMVKEFHATFGLPINRKPKYDEVHAMMRAALLAEEVSEFITALSAEDIVEIADALADIVYVAYGAALTFGIDLDKVIAEVHRSNMTKLGKDGKPVYRDDGKVAKGPHYDKPRIAEVLGV